MSSMAFVCWSVLEPGSWMLVVREQLLRLFRGAAGRRPLRRYSSTLGCCPATSTQPIIAIDPIMLAEGGAKATLIHPPFGLVACTAIRNPVGAFAVRSSAQCSTCTVDAERIKEAHRWQFALHWEQCQPQVECHVTGSIRKAWGLPQVVYGTLYAMLRVPKHIKGSTHQVIGRTRWFILKGISWEARWWIAGHRRERRGQERRRRRQRG